MQNRRVNHSFATLRELARCKNIEDQGEWNADERSLMRRSYEFECSIEFVRDRIDQRPITLNNPLSGDLTEKQVLVERPLRVYRAALQKFIVTLNEFNEKKNTG